VKEGSKMTRHAINPGGGYDLPLSSAIVVNGFVFASGHVGVDVQGQPLNGIEAQTRKVMEDLKAVLGRQVLLLIR